MLLACIILSLFMQFVKISHVAASIVLLLDLYQAIDFVGYALWLLALILVP